MAIHRAHTLIVSIGADTADDLADELRSLARRIDLGELTVGCSGGSSSGYVYSYRVRPEQTHDKYFQDIDEWLAQERAAQP